MPQNDINPWVLVVIGLIVGVSSIVLNITQESNFIVFVIIGFAMSAYGLVKYLIVRPGNDDGKQINPEKARDQSFSQGRHNMGGTNHQSANPYNGRRGITPQNFNNRAPAHTRASTGNTQKFGFCPRCGARIPTSANFCSFCGLRLR